MTTNATVAALEEVLEAMEGADYQTAQRVLQDTISRLKNAPIKIVEPAVRYDAAGSAAYCNRPPTGWHCTRGFGHEGPCAAYPLSPVTV